MDALKPPQVYIHLQRGLYFFVRFINMAIQNFQDDLLR